MREVEELALEVEELNAALTLAQRERDDLRGRFQQYVYASAVLVARDLVSLLNRARELGIAVCPDVDEREGISYSVEWAFDGARWDLDVEWMPNSGEWTCIASRSDGEANHVQPSDVESVAPPCAVCHCSGCDNCELYRPLAGSDCACTGQQVPR